MSERARAVLESIAVDERILGCWPDVKKRKLCRQMRHAWEGDVGLSEDQHVAGLVRWMAFEHRPPRSLEEFVARYEDPLENIHWGLR